MEQEQWAVQRAELMARLSDWVGPLDERGPLDATEHSRREYRTHTELKVSYDGGRGKRIPAYLLIPRDAPEGRLPAVFAAHQCGGACDIGKEQVVGKSPDWPDQAYGLELAREGFVVLAPDANKVGERFDPARREQWQAQEHFGGSARNCCQAPGGTWGAPPAKAVWDVMRGIDFLCEHPRVDANRIGIIGHSMGMQTALRTLPFEPRIRAAAVSGGGGAAMQGWYPNGLPFADLLKLPAPRPLFYSCGTEDPGCWVTNLEELAAAERDGPDLSVPVDERMRASREATEATREVYRLSDASEAVARFEFQGGHSFRDDARRAAYDWLRRWLMAPDG